MCAKKILNALNIIVILIFSEAQGLDFLTKNYIEAILERRDQVIKAYESVNDKKTSI